MCVFSPSELKRREKEAKKQAEKAAKAAAQKDVATATNKKKVDQISEEDIDPNVSNLANLVVVPCLTLSTLNTWTQLHKCFDWFNKL